MKRIIFLTLLFIIVLIFASVQIKAAIPLTLNRHPEKTIGVHSGEIMSSLNRRLPENDKLKTDSSNEILNSTEVEQINNINRIVHRIIHTKSINSVLRILLRNREDVDGQTEVYPMTMFALGLPSHVNNEDINSIRFARKEYTNVDDLDDMSSLNWQEMEVPDLTAIEDLEEYTKSNVLNIEEGIVENDWLIVEIVFNKLYLDAEFMPYYFKVAENWYPTTMLGVGKPDPEFQE